MSIKYGIDKTANYLGYSSRHTLKSAELRGTVNVPYTRDGPHPNSKRLYKKEDLDAFIERREKKRQAEWEAKDISGWDWNAA